jgi:hypothetical protein
MGTLFFLVCHFFAKFNTQYDFVILSFLLSLDSLAALKFMKVLRK